MSDRKFDQAEYLRRKYGIGDGSEGKVKKKKSKTIELISQKTNLRIHDDDIEIKAVKSKKGTDNLDIYFGVDEDKPVVQDIIDDRPTAVKNREKQGTKWKPLAGDDDDKDGGSDKVLSGSNAKGKSKKVTHGLTTAAEMREERHKVKEREKKMLSQLDVKISGKEAKSVYRDRKTGRARDLEKEKVDAEAKKQEYEARTAKERQKFKEMTIGLKQVEVEKKRQEEEEKLIAEPFARHEDDTTYLNYCAQQALADDPMMAYLNQKQEEKEKDENKDKDDKKKAKVPWKGSVPPPPNRFNILPGHRWDGVDRSNGYEQKYFARLAEKEAVKEEAYRWATEDM